MGKSTAPGGIAADRCGRQNGGNEDASLRVERARLPVVVHALEQLLFRLGCRWNFGEARGEVLPDGHRVDERFFAVVRRDEAVASVLFLDDFAEVRRDLKAAFVINGGGGMPHQDIEFHK